MSDALGAISRGFAAVALAAACSATGLAQTAPLEPRDVRVEFTSSVYADFLYYALNRSVGPYKELPQAVPLTDVPKLDHLVYLPDEAVDAHIAKYPELYGLASSYDDHVAIETILARGEPVFPRFESFWRATIGPAEERQIATWTAQQSTLHPLVRLQQLERLPFPSDSIVVAAMMLNPSAASNAGATPPTVFTSADGYHLAWVLGHEATHVIVGPKGANWQARADGKRAIALVEKRGGTPYDIEEALCLLMQVRLPEALGARAPGFRTSRELEPSIRRAMLVRMEDARPAWSARPRGTIVDFMLENALAVLSA